MILEQMLQLMLLQIGVVKVTNDDNQYNPQKREEKKLSSLKNFTIVKLKTMLKMYNVIMTSNI